MIKWFFNRDLSAAHCTLGLGVALCAERGHYLAALAVFLIAIPFCAAGELILLDSEGED